MTSGVRRYIVLSTNIPKPYSPSYPASKRHGLVGGKSRAEMTKLITSPIAKTVIQSEIVDRLLEDASKVFDEEDKNIKRQSVLLASNQPKTKDMVWFWLQDLKTEFGG
jgi:hypothetical protein